jgi:toxin ParE1/3/4
VSVRVWKHPKAQDDLLEIWLRIAKENVAAADRLLDQIELKCRTLVDFPEIGPPREDIGRGVRVLTVGNYLVLYRAGRQRAEIVRVVHGARDLRAFF